MRSKVSKIRCVSGRAICLSSLHYKHGSHTVRYFRDSQSACTYKRRWAHWLLFSRILIHRRLLVSVTNRKTALIEKHSQIDTAIDAERNRPQPDELRIQSLKRQKLWLKDQLTAA